MKFNLLRSGSILTLAYSLKSTIFILAIVVSASAQFIVPDGGGEFTRLPKDEMSDEQRIEIQNRIRENVERLEKDGKLLYFSPQAVPLSWPVRKAAGLSDFNIDGISNFVDQNLSFPNQLLDWNCGTRTYDQASGYNHKGIDIFTWPFAWNKMDRNEVEVIAAAPGSIVFKSDGNLVRSCGFNANQWNAVYVRHADNSTAWYGHMKSGSLTTKGVGDTVEVGERLGVVGSSGNSTGPHLHFELYNSSNQLQDPYVGPCNTLNNFSWWAQQPDYRISRINKLMTQSAGPTFPACPLPEITNEKNVFRGGDMLFTAAYFRDQTVGQPTQYSLVRPDGSTFQNWSHNSPNTYNASYWWWSRQLPTDAGSGIWKFRASHNSQNYEKTFVVPHSPYSYDTDRRADLSVRRPSDNTWYLLRGLAGYTAIQWGEPGDRMAPADYDGDGVTDAAMFRPSTGVWYIFYAGTFTFQTFTWGQIGDVPIPADRDGDGKAELLVYRESNNTWYSRSIATGVFGETVFGEAGDKPVRGDFDADGIWDIAVYRPSNGNWYIIKSSLGYFVQTWGKAGDIPLTGDFDGDGATDQAVFRPSTGQWYLSRTTAGFGVSIWGVNGDIPVAADYDGDGRTDIAVFRPSEGNWYILNSTAGIQIQQFGQNGDVPTPSAYLP